MFQFVDFYALLDITSSAKPDEIVAAFDKEVKLWHSGGYPRLNERKEIKDIIEAKRVLLDPALRVSYDIEYNRRLAKKKPTLQIKLDSNVHRNDEWLKNMISEAKKNMNTHMGLTYFYVVNEILVTGFDEKIISSIEFRAPHSTLLVCRNDANRFFENRRKLIEYRISLGIYEIQNNQTSELNISLIESSNGTSTSYITRSVQKQVPKSNLDYEQQVLKKYPVDVNSWQNSQTNIHASPGTISGDQVDENDEVANFVNYYANLEVKPDATTEEIDYAYRRLSIKFNSSIWHPDWHDGKDTYKRTREIHDAYKILSEAALRAEYDLVYKRDKAAQYKRENEHKGHDEFGIQLKTDEELLDIYVNASRYGLSYIDATIKELGKRNYTDEKLHHILRSRKKDEEREGTYRVVTDALGEKGEIVKIEKITLIQRIKRFLFGK